MDSYFQKTRPKFHLRGSNAEDTKRKRFRRRGSSILGPETELRQRVNALIENFNPRNAPISDLLKSKDYKIGKALALSSSDKANNDIVNENKKNRRDKDRNQHSNDGATHGRNVFKPLNLDVVNACAKSVLKSSKCKWAELSKEDRQKLLSGSIENQKKTVQNSNPETDMSFHPKLQSKKAILKRKATARTLRLEKQDQRAILDVISNDEDSTESEQAISNTNNLFGVLMDAVQVVDRNSRRAAEADMSLIDKPESRKRRH